MSSRKSLKKSVNYICGQLFAECIINSKKDSAEADKVMTEILKVQDDFVSRISHTEPGNTKTFYKKFRSDFDAKTNEIINSIDKLNA